jgi:hypothetical protein
MRTITAARIPPETVKRLTDDELERELTLTALRSHRRAVFDALLEERQFRHREASSHRLLSPLAR